MSETVQVEMRGTIAFVTINNPPVNATSTAVRADLLAAVERVQGCELAVLRCAGRSFVAGGDMSEFDAPPVEPHLPDVVNAIDNSATPFLAILHGTVLGGGFEIAMACAYRIALPGTRFGLPEVNLGLVPGAGGTQRAPRLLGWKMAVEMACLGQLKTAEDLLELGAVDAISEMPDDLIESFRGRAFQRVSERRLDTGLDRDAFMDQVQKFSKGRKGPMHNLDALSWASEDYTHAQPRERALHLELRQSQESKALRHLFFAERAATKPNVLSDVQPKQINHVVVVGGGLMGAGIAAACLNTDRSVTIVERDKPSATKAQETVAGLMQGALKRGKITQSQLDTRLSALITTDSYAAASGADLAIEAVFEDLGAKRAVFTALSNVMTKDALLATNTSYIDPNEIFDGVPNPDRCLGIHFFSPAHIMKLVEVIRADGTTNESLATAFSFAKSLRKTPVLSGVCDGFIGNRILAAYRRAAEYLLADGALPHEVDNAMRTFGMAMGPFEAQDQSGLQIAYANRRRQDATRDPAERYVAISDRLCELERFGRRSGAGWYNYPDGKTPAVDPSVTDLILQYSDQPGLSRRAFSATEIQTQLLAAMANEGARIVEEGIAANEADVDVVKTAGYGFPRWRGGPMHWAKTQGGEAMRATLKTMEKASPGSWIRADRYQDKFKQVRS